MTVQYVRYPNLQSANGVNIYATFSALPASATKGTLAVTADTGYVYEYNGTSWVVVAGPGAVLSVGSPANGLSLSSNTLSLALSSSTTVGSLSAVDWNTFNNKQNALTFSAPILNTAGTISITQATTSSSGYLSSTDWNTFNGKQSAGNYITALTGDATATGPGSAALTLATVNTNTGSFGSSTAIPSFTVNGKGLVTAASSSAVVAPAGTLSGTTLNSAVVTSSLSALGTQSQALNMGSNKISALAAPTVATDAATKGYVDAAINGLTWQPPVKAYAASNVPLTGSTPLVIDGYTVLNNDTLILAHQTTAAQDGIYLASITGGTYALTATGAPAAIGDAWLVLDGTVYTGSAFLASAVVPAATFVVFAGPTSYTFNAPLSLTGNTVSMGQATASTAGYLSSADWNTFNNKQAAGSYITALTGDVTASGPGSAASTLATVNTNTGSFGSSTAIPSFTVNGKGLITAASSSAVVAPAGTLSGTTLNSTVTGSSLTSVGTITSGTWNGTTISTARGGTGASTASGALNNILPTQTGNSGQFLTTNGTAASWAVVAPTYSAPVIQSYVAGSYTYSTPSKALYLKVTMSGGGGGGSGSQSGGSAPNGVNGNTTSFDTMNAYGGYGGNGSSSGSGGGYTLGTHSGVGWTGGFGSAAVAFGAGGSFYPVGGSGGQNPLGGNSVANSGAGGGGGFYSSNAAGSVGGGGGAGGYVEAIITSPGSTYSVVVGTGGAGGVGNISTGSSGSDGIVIVEAYFQ